MHIIIGNMAKWTVLKEAAALALTRLHSQLCKYWEPIAPSLAKRIVLKTVSDPLSSKPTTVFEFFINIFIL